MRHILYPLLLLAVAQSAMFAQPFAPVDTKSVPPSAVLPSGYTYRILFRAGESQVLTEQDASGPARGSHDYIAFLPDNGSSTRGQLFVSHETSSRSELFGDGGGMTTMEIEKQDGKWEVIGPHRSIDFSDVGGTWENCGGIPTPHGTLLTSEENPPSSNLEMYGQGNGVLDTSDFSIEFNGERRTLKRFQNMGWMVEIDPTTRRAVRKLYKMGRFSHESALCMPDRKTVFLTDDHEPAVLFKFIAKNAGDFSDGSLFAYRQTAEGMMGLWVPLPMELDSLVDIRNVALRHGATVFMRHEWITMVNGKLYIAETGSAGDRPGVSVTDSLTKAFVMGGALAVHLRPFIRRASHDTRVAVSFLDPYGRILEISPASGKMRVLLEGGPAATDPTKYLNNPDCIAHTKIDGKNYLVICEDPIGAPAGKTPPEMLEKSEVYWLDMSIESPTVDKLQRFLVAPKGGESTGAAFTPDGSTFFINIQDPGSGNTPPFDASVTLAIDIPMPTAAAATGEE